MGDIADLYDHYDDDDERVTCKRCGRENLFWYEIRKPDGNPGWALFTLGMRRHHCPPASPDEFEALA